MSSNTFNYQEAHIEDDRRTAVIVASVICVIGACVAVALRLIARKIVQAKLQSDDWMIILGLVSYLKKAGLTMELSLLIELTLLSRSFSP